MAFSVSPVLKFTEGFVVTPSDTVDIADDVNNLQDVPAVYLHNVAAGATVRVLPAGQRTAVPLTIFIPQGGYSDILVKRVYATTPVPPAGLLAVYGGTRG